MNGANAEVSAKMMSKPKSTNMITIGASHHFLLSFKKPQNSLTIATFPTTPPLDLIKIRGGLY